MVRCLRCVLMFGPPGSEFSGDLRRGWYSSRCHQPGEYDQGNTILAGNASLDLAWKVPLTYAVHNSYRQRRPQLSDQRTGWAMKATPPNPRLETCLAGAKSDN